MNPIHIYYLIISIGTILAIYYILKDRKYHFKYLEEKARKKYLEFKHNNKLGDAVADKYYYDSLNLAPDEILDQKDDKYKILDYPVIRFFIRLLITLKANLLFFLNALFFDVVTSYQVSMEKERFGFARIAVIMFFVKVFLIIMTIYAFFHTDDGSYILFFATLVAVEFIYFGFKNLFFNNLKGLVSFYYLEWIGFFIIDQIQTFYDDVIRYTQELPHNFVFQLAKALFNDPVRNTHIEFSFYYNFWENLSNILDPNSGGAFVKVVIYVFLIFFYWYAVPGIVGYEDRR